MRSVLAPLSVATFAANIPLRHLLGVSVISNGVTAVAQRSGRALVILRAIERYPPVRVVGDVVLAPLLVLHFPLCPQRKVVIPHLGEVALLPQTAVNQCDLIL